MSVLFIELLNGGGSSLLYLASILYWRSALAMVSTPMNKKSNKCCMLLQSRLHHFQVDTKDFCGGVNIVFVYQFLHISNHKRKYFSVLISYAVFGKIALHLLFGWSLDKYKKKFGSIQTILMKVWIDPN